MPNRKRLLLLYNPVSGRAQCSRNLDMMIQQCSRAGYEISIAPVMPGSNAEDILARYSESGFDLIICSGGDGTLHHTVNGLCRMENKPLLGYVPAGSTNDFAASLNLSKNPESACKAILSGTPHAIDIGDFGGELFCYVAAFGAFSAVSYATPQNMKNAMGHLAYIIEGIRNLPIGQKYPARIEADGNIYEEDFLFCSISNTTYIGGLPLDKNLQARLDDGKFEVLLIRAPENVAEANTIIAKLLSGDFENDFIHLLHTDCVSVHFPVSTAWSLDGEYGGEPTDITIRVHSGVLKMLF